MPDTLEQLVDLVGKLDDSPGESTPRERFRKYLREQIKDVGRLRDYVDESLRLKGDQATQANRALQDLVNRIGELLGFSVTFGRYSGVANQIGFDGRWFSTATDFHVVVEVKTTEVYAIKTATLLNYINELVSAQVIPGHTQAMGLYVVGSPDPDIKQVENAIVAEHLNDRLRIISVESLLTLADLMANYDVVHADILALIRPSAPTIDSTVNLLNRVVGQTPVLETPEVLPVAPIAPEPLDMLSPLSESTSSPRYWLTPVSAEPGEKAEDIIQSLVGAETPIYAFRDNNPGRKKVKPGDHICFYAAGSGVVADAEITSYPEHKNHPAIHGPLWVFDVTDVRLYLDEPVILADVTFRGKLDAFEPPHDPVSWSWFVQQTRPISEHDFEILTRSSGKGPVMLPPVQGNTNHVDHN